MVPIIGIKSIIDALVIMSWAVVYSALVAYLEYLDRKIEG
jgi:hypothetical protein